MNEIDICALAPLKNACFLHVYVKETLDIHTCIVIRIEIECCDAMFK